MSYDHNRFEPLTMQSCTPYYTFLYSVGMPVSRQGIEGRQLQELILLASGGAGRLNIAVPTVLAGNHQFLNLCEWEICKVGKDNNDRHIVQGSVVN